MIGIYKIINNINGKIYVGQSIDIKERWKQHKYKAFNPNEKGYPSIIHVAFRKYGIENFSFEIIEECEIEELDNKECYWIRELNTLTPNGYNMLPGGQGTRALLKPRFCSICGKTISRDNKSGKCASCCQTKLFITKEALEEKLLEFKGNFTKIGDYFGLSDNAIRKKCKNYGLSSYSSDYKDKKEKVPIKKPVFQIDVETNEIIKKFNSIADAARELGVSRGSHITEVCKGKNKTAYGYKWKYVED